MRELIVRLLWRVAIQFIESRLQRDFDLGISTRASELYDRFATLLPFEGDPSTGG